MNWRPIIRAFAAAQFLLVHMFLATLLITGIYYIQVYIKYLWGTQEPVLFGHISLVTMFDAIDFGVIGVFGIRGIWAAWKAFDTDDE